MGKKVLFVSSVNIESMGVDCNEGKTPKIKMNIREKNPVFIDRSFNTILGIYLSNLLADCLKVKNIHPN